jgi:hypothetical protein
VPQPSETPQEQAVAVSEPAPSAEPVAAPPES